MLRSIYLLSFLLLQSLFAFAGNVKENVPSSFDLYVCIGQSNMAGPMCLFYTFWYNCFSTYNSVCTFYK